jgi:peptide/nickel transport system ATP-binding protein
MRYHDYPSQFSGGMMQRALIVDALVTNPAFLVADNVTQPLDVTVAAQVLRLMKELTDDVSTRRSVRIVVAAVVSDACRSDPGSGRRQGRRASRQRGLVNTPAIPIPASCQPDPKIWTSEAVAVDPPAETRKPIISMRDASRSYRVRKSGTFASYNRSRRAQRHLRRLSGDSFAIVGESGCGKSTLMRLLSGWNGPIAARSSATDRISPRFPARGF